MLNKIAFLCVNPWESFLPAAFQGYIKSYYQWICKETLLREETMYCQERIALYGEPEMPLREKLFQNKKGAPQLLYVQSHQKELLQKVFKMADLVVVGMSGSKRECDKIFMNILPWKEKILFLWDNRICDKSFLKKIKREYGLADRQLLEAKKLPSFLTEALKG